MSRGTVLIDLFYFPLKIYFADIFVYFSFSSFDLIYVVCFSLISNSSNVAGTVFCCSQGGSSTLMD